MQLGDEPAAIEVAGLVREGSRGLAEMAFRILAPFSELVEDTAALVAGPAKGEPLLDDGNDEGSTLEAGRGEGECVAESLSAMAASIADVDIGNASVAICCVAVPVKIVCALAAALLASCAKGMLDRVPQERRLKAVQQRCAVALGASGAVYAGLLFPLEFVLPHLYRPDLVFHCVGDGVASSLFILNLSTLAEQQHWKACPAVSWSLMSTFMAALAALDPTANLYEHLAMLGLSSCCALFSGRRARQLAECAESEENRHRSQVVSNALSLSMIMCPLLQGLALLHPASGIVSFAALDLVFKCGIAHSLLGARSLSSTMQQQLTTAVGSATRLSTSCCMDSRGGRQP